MRSKDGPTRRRLLRSAAAVAAAGGLAGCSALSDDGTANSTDRRDRTTESGAGSAVENGSPSAAAEGSTPANGSRTVAPETTGAPEPRVAELAATVAGWRGRRPTRIEGEMNPAIRLLPGETLEIRWFNLDGERHQLVVADAEGTVVATTEPASEKGATRVLRIEEAPGATVYRCKFHPQAMRGQMTAGEPAGGGNESTPGANGTANATGGAASTTRRRRTGTTDGGN